MWAALKFILFCFVLQCTMQGTFATVGGACDSCDADTEVCENTKCVCAENHINTGDGTCVSSACTPAETACNNIDNSVCTTDTCVCNEQSEVATADDETKGSCVVKSIGSDCTGNTQCSGVVNAVCTGGFCKCDSGFSDVAGVCKAHAGSTCSNTGDCVTNADCVSGSCACNVNYVAVEGLCKAQAGSSCSETGDCATNADCVSDLCACTEDYVAVQGLCKAQAGSACSDTADCVTNANCDSTSTLCTCNENYVDVEGLCKDTVGDCITDPADTCEDPGAVCETEAQKCYCPNGVEETGACKIDRSGGSTRRPFVGGALMFAVVTALRLLN